MTKTKTKLLDFVELIGTHKEIRLVIIDSDCSIIDEKRFSGRNQLVAHLNHKDLQKYYSKLDVTSLLILDDYTYLGAMFPE